jgi:threonine/homoserine/homoserine lactone efflux protein
MHQYSEITELVNCIGTVSIKNCTLMPMPIQEFFALLALGTAMSFTPGPNTTLSTALAANRGLRGAMHFVCSVPVGWITLFMLCAAGLGALVQAEPALRIGIKTLGIGYLLWLAIRLAQSGDLTQVNEERLNVTFWQGALLQFVNIKAWFTAITMVAGWFAGKPDPALRLAVLIPTLMGFAFFSNLTYALIGASLRGWLAQGARLLWFNRVMALVLVLTAVWMTRV